MQFYELTLQCLPWTTVQTLNSSYTASLSALNVCECIYGCGKI